MAAERRRRADLTDLGKRTAPWPSPLSWHSADGRGSRGRGRLDATQPETGRTWHAGGYELNPRLRRALSWSHSSPRYIDLGAVCEQRYPDSLRELTAALLNPRNSLAHYDAAMVLDGWASASRLKSCCARCDPDEPLKTA